MNGNIPHVRLTIGEEEIEAVQKVLRSGHVAMGPAVADLEAALAKEVQQTTAVAVNSGTAALHVALVALGVGEGDEVILPDYSCQALLNAVAYVAATPRIVDIDSTTFNINPTEVKKHISKKTKAIIVPHMFGLMTDIATIKSFGVPVIEDCAMGIGAKSQGAPAGSFGDISVFSFYATKMIAGGEGGAIATSNEAFAEAARDIRDYDKKKDYRIRFNYKLSDLHAALALSQLRKLRMFVEKRQAIARTYHEALLGTKVSAPQTPQGYEHAFARYVVRTESGEKLRGYLSEKGIGAGKGVVFGIHELTKAEARYPESERALVEAVSLPIYPTLTDAEQQTIIEALRAY